MNPLSDLELFYDTCIQKLQSEQMKTGEFGLSRVTEVVGIVSPYHNSATLGKKPNSFITMYAIELLKRLNVQSDAVLRALEWFHSRVSLDGYFSSNVIVDEQVEDLVTGRIISSPRKIKIYRHTAEALHAFITNEGVNSLSTKMLLNLLEAQNSDGGWSASSENSDSQILSTSFALKAITALPSSKIAEDGFPRFEKERVKKNIDLAVEKALNWFSCVYKNTRGLFYGGIEREENKAFYTGIVLGMTPELFLQTYPEMTKELVGQLIQSSADNVWKRNNQIDINGTARILSALVKINKDCPLGYSFENAIYQLSEEIEKQDCIIDPATLCFVVDTLYNFLFDSYKHNGNAQGAIAAVIYGARIVGTGTILSIGSKKLCFTCKHLFTDKASNKYQIKLNNGSTVDMKFYSDEIINENSAAVEDIVFFDLGNAEYKGFQATSSTMTVGESFYSFGFGESTKGRGSWVYNITYMGVAACGFIEFSCGDQKMEHGYSGAPIFNSRNEIVGIVQAVRADRIYAIPSDSLIKYYNNKEKQDEQVC